LGPFAGFVFSGGPSLNDTLLGGLTAAFVVLPLPIARPWARVLGSLALVFWFMLGLGYVYSGV
jgi:hypothetical protein